MKDNFKHYLLKLTEKKKKKKVDNPTPLQMLRILSCTALVRVQYAVQAQSLEGPLQFTPMRY